MNRIGPDGGLSSKKQDCFYKDLKSDPFSQLNRQSEPFLQLSLFELASQVLQQGLSLRLSHSTLIHSWPAKDFTPAWPVSQWVGPCSGRTKMALLGRAV
jgi:hypothetical protein